MNLIFRSLTRPVSLGIIGILLFTANSMFYQVRQAVYYEYTTDLASYYGAAYYKSQQKSGVYNTDDVVAITGDRVTTKIRPYLYPPWFAEALTPVASLSFKQFHILWIVVTHIFLVFLFAATLALIQRHAGQLGNAETLIPLLGFILFSPIEREIFYGQVTIFLSLLIYTAIVIDLRGHYRFAGALIALAGLIKIYPAAALIWQIARFRLSGITTFFATVAVVVLLSGMFFGFADWQSFLHLHGSGEIGNTMARADLSERMATPNFSINHFIFVTSQVWNLELHDKTIIWLGRLAIVLFATVYLAFMWKCLWLKRESFEFFQLSMCGIMLISPVLWNHIFILVLPGIIFLLVKHYRNCASSGYTYFCWLAVSYCMIALPDYGVNLSLLDAPVLSFLKPVKLYGLLLYIGILTKMLLSEQETYIGDTA